METIILLVILSFTLINTLVISVACYLVYRHMETMRESNGLLKELWGLLYSFKGKRKSKYVRVA